VRQASLAPQLRRTAAAEPATGGSGEETVVFRSPDQVRSIMSALQRGTTRGRIDASKYVETEGNRAATPGDGAESVPEERSNGPEKGDDGRPVEASVADAATVIFPAIVHSAIRRDEASAGGGTDAAGDLADSPGGSEVSRPEKDA
jgi:hypothetical protein